MQIEDSDPETVNRLVQWLYRGEYQIPDGKVESEAEEFHLGLARLSTLADKYDMPALVGSVTDKMVTYYSKDPRYPPQKPVIVYTYENSSSSSTFRKILVSWHAYHINKEWYDFQTTKDFLCEQPKFAADLAIELGRHKPCNPSNLCLLHGTKLPLQRSK